MEKLSQIRAQLFLHNRYAVFTMGGTVALWIVDIFFTELQFCSLKYIAEVLLIVKYAKKYLCIYIHTLHFYRNTP